MNWSVIFYRICIYIIQWADNNIPWGWGGFMSSKLGTGCTLSIRMRTVHMMAMVLMLMLLLFTLIWTRSTTCIIVTTTWQTQTFPLVIDSRISGSSGTFKIFVRSSPRMRTFAWRMIGPTTSTGCGSSPWKLSFLIRFQL